jgi:hypothetical protein
MIAPPNKHQMSRHSSSWGTSFHGGFSCVEAPVAYDEQQVCRAVLPVCLTLFLPVSTGRRPQVAGFSRASACGPNLCCAFKSRSRSIHFTDQPRRQAIADLFHRSTSALGHEQTSRARGLVNVRNSVGEIRNVRIGLGR